MNHSKILLLILFAASLIKAQAPKTVKIGNQVWMSENLGTSSMSNQALPSNNKTTPSITTSNTTANCNFKFIRPNLSFEYIDNRKTCCCCKKRYSKYRSYPSEQNELGQVMITLTYNLLNHWKQIGATDAHKEEDIERFARFYGNEVIRSEGSGYDRINDKDYIQFCISIIKDTFIDLVQTMFVFDPNHDAIIRGSSKRKVDRYILTGAECTECYCGCK